MRKEILLFTVFFCCLNLSFGQAGKLDASFGGKGWVTANFPKFNYFSENALQILPQKNGTYVVLIGGDTPPNSLGRFLENGDLDSSFGKEGYSIVDSIRVIEAVQQSDGKFVVAGARYYPNNDFALSRYTIDGSPDSTFGTNGRQITGISVNALAMQSDGKIVAAGNSNGNFAIVRYNSDGAPDLSFAENGILLYDFFGRDDNILSVAVQSDGKIIVSGTISIPKGECDKCVPYVETENTIVRYTSNGSIDSSFDGDGKINPGSAYSSLALQDDGKIVVYGITLNSIENDVVLTRYNTDGSPDLSFNENGKVITDFGYDDFPSSVAFQDDGKIVVTVWTGGPVFLDSKNFFLARYNSNGSPDTSFDGDGKLTTNFGLYNFANSVAVQSDGKIVVAGGTYGTSDFDFALARYNADGSPDNNFSADGKEVGYIPAQVGFLNTIAVQPDGKIVVAGSAYVSSAQTNFFISRYNSDGSRDRTFSTDKSQITGFEFKSVAIQNDGKIVAAGTITGGRNTTYNIDTSYFAVARFNKDGSVDSTFSSDGKQITYLSKNYFSYSAYSVALQADGKIVVGGAASGIGPGTDFAVARYNSDGSPDHSFSNDGMQTTDFSLGSDVAFSIAIQDDQKIVLAGRASNSSSDFALARYNTDGSLDNTFNGDGKQTTDFASDNDDGNSVAIQKDGKIVLAGSTSNNNGQNQDIGIVRYNIDGSLDTTFSEDGKQVTDFASNNDYAGSVAIQSGGKIVVAGLTLDISFAEDIAIARYNTDGSLDNNFGLGGKVISDFGSNERASAAVIYNDRLYAAGNNIVAAYNLTDTDTSTPTVTLSIPYNIVKYTGPARIKLNAAVANVSGTITKVQFYNDTTLLHTEDVFPYGFLWIDVPAGSYSLTAKAFDNGGNLITSNSINVSVVGSNVAPVVSIVSPVDDTTYTGPATIRLIANAKDPNDKISKVEFYSGTALIRTEYYYPYTYTWSNVQPGTYTITAKAYDDKGLSATSDPIVVTVTSSMVPIVSSRPASINDQTDLRGTVSMRLSPNPVGSTLQIFTKGLQLNKPTTISVISAAGVVMKTIQSNALNKVVQLDVSSMVSGVYTIKVISADKVLYKQFVKL